MPLTAEAVKNQALALGFDLCGIAPASAHPELAYLREWLAQGYSGEMTYLSRTADRRADVRAVVPGARSVIVTATVYNTDRPYSIDVGDATAARLARYGWGDDYHDVIGARLQALLAWMRTQSADEVDARAYVDTGPVQERVYAQYAGLGWVGKNTCLINRDLGSWLFLGEIITTLALEPDAPGVDHCGRCTLCLDACPTGALVAPHVMDATRCLSYLTIELKGAIPEAQREDVGSHVYGCDICQDICPYNVSPAVSAAPEWQPRQEIDQPRLIDLWRRSDAEWRTTLRGSAMRRAKLRGLRRNLAVALGNSGSEDAEAALSGACIDDPLVSEHVDWAIARLQRRD